MELRIFVPTTSATQIDKNEGKWSTKLINDFGRRLLSIKYLMILASSPMAIKTNCEIISG